MAIDPNISLNVRPVQVRGPLESFERAVTVRDMIQRMKSEKETERLRQAEVKLREAQVTAEERRVRDESIFNETIGRHVKYDPAKKDLDYDDAAITSDLQKLGAAHLLPKFNESRQKMLETARERAIKELDDTIRKVDMIGVPAENFLALSEDQRGGAYPSLIQTLGRLDPSIPAKLPPQYGPDALGLIQGVADQRKQIMTVGDQLKEAQARKAITAPPALKTDHFPPGSRVRVTDQSGKVVEQFDVPFKPEDKPDAQVKRELVEEAYGQLKLKGKTREQMTAAEKHAAKIWDEGLTAAKDPEKLTDMQRLMQLYRSGKKEDMALFNALKGNFEDEKEPTVSNKVSIMNAVLGASKKIGRDQIDPELYEKNRKLYLPIWPSIPGYDAASKLPVGPPPTPVSMGDVRKEESSTRKIAPAPAAPKLPKPPKKGAQADTAILKQYLDAAGGDQEKALKALEDAGWQ